LSYCRWRDKRVRARGLRRAAREIRPESELKFRLVCCDPRTLGPSYKYGRLRLAAYGLR